MGADKSESNKKWQDTLYIWDGIVTIDMSKVKTDDAEGADDDKSIPVQWEGTWVPVEASDATKAPAPKRNAFAEYVDSDMKFTVSGTANPLDEEGDDQWLVAKLTEGDGWDMDDGSGGEMKKYKDETHDVMVKSLKWSGNMFDQTENLIVAKGTNEFGHFVSAGWIRPGNRWTLARRYLPDDKDPRSKWAMKQLLEYVVNESVELVEDSGQKKLKIPPWQCTVFHAEYQEPPESTASGQDDKTDERGEKRKLEELDDKEDGGAAKEPKQ
mmetsp:Transcript_14722/g.23809  ORF Transcript_14722/g.23809 Transcript_14722/m.23809 type:complete len:269 (+) Transcript_14722:145-951(+)